MRPRPTVGAEPAGGGLDRAGRRRRPDSTIFSLKMRATPRAAGSPAEGVHDEGLDDGGRIHHRVPVGNRFEARRQQFERTVDGPDQRTQPQASSSGVGHSLSAIDLRNPCNH